jgi:prepilin-type N-terminal cleavage/methylation domain-containing protein
MEKAFTLIELLVVIAIVGILAGLAVVNMSGATEAARIAKLKVYSNSIRSSLMGNRVSEWRFDETSGTTTADTVGTNTGTLNGFNFDSTSGWRSGPSCVSGGCLQLDGTDDYVTIPNDLTGGFSEITVEAWVKGSQAANLFVAPGNAIILHFRGAGFYLVAEDGTVSNYLGWSSAPELDKWIHLVATWNGTKMALYQNGSKQSSTRDWSGGTTGKLLSSGAFYIGKYFNAGQPYFKGQIDDVRVYKQALTLTQIRSDYLAGLDKLLANGQITNQDYQKRLADLNSTYAVNE